MLTNKYDPKSKEKKKTPSMKCRSNCAVHKLTIKPKETHLYHPAAAINYLEKSRNMKIYIPK